MTIQKKVLVACLSDPSGDPRPRRDIDTCLASGFLISVLSFPFNRKTLDGVNSFFSLNISRNSLFSKVMRRVWAIFIAICPFERGKVFLESLRFGLKGARENLSGKVFDLIIVEDLQLLPLAFSVRGKAKILFDAREYYPKQNEESLWFNLIERPRRIQLCRKYMAKCDAVVTVSEGLKSAFKKEFGINSTLYRSTPSYVDMPIRPTEKGHVRMVYHGAANRNRQLEKLIKILSFLDNRFSLDFFLIGNPGYQSELKKLASTNLRVRFMNPVLFEDIIPTISGYDVGLFYCEPSTFNLKHCLPNKFFEYIQARIMVAIGPSPDMAELVKKYGCGVVSESFSVESMAEALNGLSCEDIDRAKRCCDVAAKELCFEEESKIMRGIIQKLIGE